MQTQKVFSLYQFDRSYGENHIPMHLRGLIVRSPAHSNIKSWKNWQCGLLMNFR